MKFVAIVFLVACLAACNDASRSPVSPTPTPSPTTPASISGTWAGSYAPVCPGSPTCGMITGQPLGMQQFALVLNQTGETLTGQISLAGWMTGRVANVTGTLAADGAMTLQGGDSWPARGFCEPAGGWRISTWNGRFDAGTRTIAGDFSFITQKHLSSCYYMSDLSVSATNMRLEPGTLPEQPFAGHWQGTYAIGRCTPVGWPSCTPSPSGDVRFDLNLTQTGNTVSGTAMLIPFSNATPLPVTGSVSADGMLTLTGARSELVSSATHTIRLTGWSTMKDNVGRLQGTFSYVDEVEWTGGPDRGRTFSTSYDSELRNVIRVSSS